MNKKLLMKNREKDIISAKAEQAVLNVLPVDQKTLQRTAKILEPKNLKRIGIAVVGGSALISIITSFGHDRINRAAMSHEVKKQLVPVMNKLNELEALNVSLLQQNKELMALVMKDSGSRSQESGSRSQESGSRIQEPGFRSRVLE